MNEIYQYTEEQAIKIADSGIWKDWTDQQIVDFQLFQRRLCMPFKKRMKKCLLKKFRINGTSF